MNGFSSTDLDLCAYIKTRAEEDSSLKVKIIKEEKVNGGKKVIFTFLDPDDRVEQLKIDFVNDRVYRFASNQRALKILVYQPSAVNFGG